MGDNGEEFEAEGGKRSSWMTHVRKTMKAHKGMKLKDVLKMAKKTYKKSKKGGALLTPQPLEAGPAGAPAGASTVGGKRRGSRKSRKGSRKTRKH
jgi:hypothetical protein